MSHSRIFDTRLKNPAVGCACRTNHGTATLRFDLLAHPVSRGTSGGAIRLGLGLEQRKHVGLLPLPPALRNSSPAQDQVNALDYCSSMRVSYLVSALAALLLAQDAIATCYNYSSRYQKSLTGVCVCNATHCDSVANDYTSLTSGQVGVYSTSKAGDRLAYQVYNVDTTTATSPDFTLTVSTTYQTILGFGGALTDAAAINVYLLSSTLQQKVLDAYYSETGLQYTMGRIPIASSDFSTSVYSYNDNADDFNMTKFSIDVDKAPNSNKITLINRVLNMTSRDLKLFATSWAPPAWMTTTNSTLDCALQGSPGGEYFEALALYYSKFFDAYAAEGINFWAMTVQNEPTKPTLELNKWQSLRLSGAYERDFIKLDLGPMMKKNHADVLLIGSDDQKGVISDRLEPYEDSESLSYLSGIGVHWYDNVDFLLGLGGDFDKINSFHTKYPDLFILATEACEGYLPSLIGTGAGTKLQDSDTAWTRAENYGYDIIQDLNNYASGWMDWNIVLDTTGGPNWAGNYVDAPILVDEVNGAEFYKQPMYYIMGHFSKFLPAGSVRVEFPKAANKWSSVDRTAFVDPEGRTIVFFFNRRSSSVSVSVKLPSAKTFTLTLPAHSIQTIIIPA